MYTTSTKKQSTDADNNREPNPTIEKYLAKETLKTLTTRRNTIMSYKETPGKHGVGFLIKKELKNSIVEVIGISERIAILNVRISPGRETWSIVQIYSSTEQSNSSEIDLFYS
ncbi:unnamed protein product [Pieris brassicae]|uniref:Uncharacterized protein n=1 Tax=Pieris brassicae TaxID=7116 RepID=A0A9P0TTE1_PIEBR|nr:unnamed protein product [Pieris brassicae]